MIESPAPGRASIERFRPVPGLHGMYVCAISMALAIGGGAIGVLIGALPYLVYDEGDYARLDLFFLQSLVVGAMLGLIIGCANGTRWYHAQDIPGRIQRRLTRYLRSHAQPDPSAKRSISVSYLHRLQVMQGK